MAAVNGFNFKIDMTCPRCGAPVVLDETEGIVQCSFCKTRHILHTDPFPCYYLEPGPDRPQPSELLYVPYWRFRGMEFCFNGSEPMCRVMDHSCPAVDGTGLPVSLGLRTQTRSLKFIRKGLEGVFTAPDISKQAALDQMSGGDGDKTYIGEILSLIFMPFYRDRGRMVDGLSGQVLDIAMPDLAADKKSPAHPLSFTPCLCPDCGWDLLGRTDSLVLSCKNCTSFWLIRERKLNRISAAFSGTGPDPAVLLPFWRLQVGFSRATWSTHADLMRLANVPRVVTKDQEKQALEFYIPAFRITPKLFLRLAKQITLSKPALGQAEKIPKAALYPVALPLEEGVQAVLPVLRTLAVQKKEILEILKTEKLTLTAFNLAYLSFQASGNDYVQDEAGIGFQKNALHPGTPRPDL